MRRDAFIKQLHEGMGIKDDFSTLENFINTNVIKEIILILTTHCNQKCAFCCEPPKEPGMNLENIILWLQNIYDANIYCVDFSGGEPLLHPDIIAILQASKELGLFNTLSTNGILIPKFVEHIFPYVDQWNLSFHGTETIHDLIVQNHGSYRRIREACKIIVALGAVVHMTYVVTEQNIHSVTESIETLVKDGVKKICFNYLFRRGNGRQQIAQQMMTRAEAFTFVCEVVSSLPKMDVTIYHNMNLEGQCILLRPNGNIWAVPMSNEEDFEVISHITDLKHAAANYPYIENHLNFTYPRICPILKSQNHIEMLRGLSEH